MCLFVPSLARPSDQISEPASPLRINQQPGLLEDEPRARCQPWPRVSTDYHNQGGRFAADSTVLIA